jgi:hypothetical protein
MKSTVDLTPKWAALIQPMICVLTNREASNESFEIVEEELTRCAEAADRWLAMQASDAKGFKVASWTSIVPVAIALLTDDDAPDAQRLAAEDNLLNCAKVADKWNHHCKTQETKDG